MSLYSSIKAIQKNIEKTYLIVEKRFSSNRAIQDLWSRMAMDVSRQIDSLQELPKSFWIRLKKDQEELLGTIKKEIRLQSFDDSEDLLLSDCIQKAIDSEEAIILKIYVPLIRNLRKNWSGQELNFYIMVKAHIVRFRTAAQSYSGDPEVLQRAVNLIERFEKEVQEPEIDLTRILKPVHKTKKPRVKSVPKSPKGKTDKKALPKPASKSVKPVKAGKARQPAKKSPAPARATAKPTRLSKPRPGKAALGRKRTLSRISRKGS